MRLSNGQRPDYATDSAEEGGALYSLFGFFWDTSVEGIDCRLPAHQMAHLDREPKKVESSHDDC